MFQRAFFVVTLFVGISAWGAEAATFPTFGVSFDAPAKTTFDIGAERGTIGRYKFDKTSDYAGAAITVTVRLAKGKKLADWSALTAGPTGLVHPDEATVGGEKATKVSYESPQSPPWQIFSYLVVHDGRVYTFSTESPVKVDLSKPLAEFIATVKFIPVESPTGHLDELSAINAFDLLTINGPPCIRIWQQSDSEVYLGVWDLTKPGILLNVHIRHSQYGPSNTFANSRDAMSQLLEAQFKILDHLRWSDSTDIRGLHVTQFVKTTSKRAGGKESQLTTRFCILDLGNGKQVQIQFMISETPPEVVQKYIALSDRMLATIKILEKPPATHP